MTKNEKRILGEFLARMKCSVGQHDCGIGDKECMADDAREWELFDKLKAIVGNEYGIESK